MISLDREDRKNLILSHERDRAQKLAHHVIEKPAPRVWMIFIPIFFVFYFWKIKQYEAGLKDFAENHLLPRRRMLDAVAAAEEQNRQLDLEALMDQNGSTDEKARDENVRATHRQWLQLLAAHFRLLLEARGDSYPELVRSGYRTKSNFLLSCRQLAKAETSYDLALLPAIEGDITILRQVTQAMAAGLESLMRKEAEEIFS